MYIDTLIILRDKMVSIKYYTSHKYSCIIRANIIPVSDAHRLADTQNSDYS